MRSLMIASLGNPGREYAATRHSAGHLLLGAISKFLSSPELRPNPAYAKGLTSFAFPNVLLWQSPSYMNLSGNSLPLAWKKFSAHAKIENPGDEPLLIILHDDLELDLGRASIKSGAGKSARGHNGLQDVLKKDGMKQLDFTRVGIGIGPRPESRDRAKVSEFVLQRLSGKDIKVLEALAEPVWKACNLLSQGKTAPSRVPSPSGVGRESRTG